MPPITVLPLLALLLPAGATLVCSALGRPWPRHPGFWAAVVLRLALVLTLADVLTLVDQLQPGGAVQITLWQLQPSLPVTLSVGGSSVVLAVLIVLAGLVVSCAAADRRPLASAALGLAVLGAVGAAFAGDLLSLYIGLQLSAVGGIGLSYARQPRSASGRIIWAVIADQTIGLIWLAGLVELLHHTATLALGAIPTADVSPPLAGLLLLPVVVRLGGCALVQVAAGSGRGRQRARALDVADWLAVVAVPTSLLLLTRVLALAGGSWPAPWFGTCLDLLALLLGGLALADLLFMGRRQPGLRALLLALAALVVVGFGQNTTDGVVMGLAAGLVLELAVVLLPRALAGAGRGRPAAAHLPVGPGRWLRPELSTSLLPAAAGLAVAAVGLDLGLRSGLEAGTAPALAYLVALVALVIGAPRLGQVWPGAWPLWLPAACLGAAAVLPGWAVTVAATALAPAGTSGALLISAPDPLLLLAPGLLWPGGYLIVLAVVVVAGAWALRLALATAEPGAAGPAATPASTPRDLAVLATRLGSSSGFAREVGGWYAILGRLADRELGERPVWLWLAAAAAAAWLMAEFVKP